MSGVDPREMRTMLEGLGIGMRDMSPAGFNRDNQPEKGRCPRCDTKTTLVRRKKINGSVRRRCGTCEMDYEAME